MALNKATLVDEIKTALENYRFTVTLPGGSTENKQLYDFDQKLTNPDGPNYNPAEVMISTIVDKLFDHLVSNMEVNGINTTLDNSLNVVFTSGVPVPQDGGAALQTAWKASTAGGSSDNASQNNDGTGHIA
jgi:hypothetical protein